MRIVVSALLGIVLLGTPGLATAQDVAPQRYNQVISANPFGILLELFNAEYERVVGPSSTAGIGGSFYGLDDEDYLNADVFWRYYPQGRPLQGWAFGVKVGLTRADVYVDFEEETRSYFGIGFDANHSWLLGRNDNFYVGVGFGLKRLLGTSSDEIDLSVIPTLRIINVGFAF